MEWKLLQSLTPDERKLVLTEARRCRFTRGETIFHEADPGDSLHLIANGHVAIRRSTPLGDTATLMVLGPGEFFGQMVLVSPGTARSATAVALDPTETVAVHRSQLDGLRSEHPSIDRFLLDALSNDVRRLSALLSDALYCSVEKRVIRRLLEVAEAYGTDGATDVVPLTQEDLAGLAGTTRPSANKVLRGAEEAGLIAISRGRIRLLDVAALKRRAR